MASVVTPNKKEPIVSLVLSIIPGLGQAYNGQYKKGLILFIAFIVSLVLIYATIWLFIGFCIMIVPIALWLFSMYDGYTEARKINDGNPSRDWLW